MVRDKISEKGVTKDGHGHETKRRLPLSDPIGTSSRSTSQSVFRRGATSRGARGRPPLPAHPAALPLSLALRSLSRAARRSVSPRSRSLGQMGEPGQHTRQG